jgi:adenylate cyclase
VKSQERALQRASEMVQKAIAMDDSLPDAYRLLSQVDMYKGGHYERAIADAERAIVLEPNAAIGYSDLADVLTFAGKPEAAIDPLNKAIRLDPRNGDLYLGELAFAYTVMGRYMEAIALTKRHVARFPNNMAAYSLLAVGYVELGQLDEARAEMAEVVRISPQFTLEGERRAEEHGFGVFPFKDRAVAERYLADMAKAGLK